MKVVQDLKVELEKVAPEWVWSCEEVQSNNSDLISPKTLQVRGKNKQTGAQTLAIHVSAYPNAKAPQLANFICEVLMVDKSLEQRAPQALLTER